MMHVPEKDRILTGRLASDPSYGNNGAFFVRVGFGHIAKVVASDGIGWEHVSVSLPARTPTWEEMCKVKSIFWDPEDCVVQYHPPESEYVNHHPHCLHLWRPTEVVIPRPASMLVGPKKNPGG